MKSFPHGIHPQECKEQTQFLKIKRFDFAPFYSLLLNQQIGKPSIAIVQKGEEVKRGQKVAEADGDFSSPLHAPVTGKVVQVGQSLDLNGMMQPSILIQPYPASNQITEAQSPCNPFLLNPLAIIEEVKKIGMVGLGGAAFPTHIKLKTSLDKKVDTLLINGCECEPYLTADHRVMLEHPKEILVGIRILQKALDIKKTIVAIEENKMDAARLLQSHLGEGDKIEIQVLKAKYPQGAEKVLIKALLGFEVPSGGLPADLKIMVANVTTLYELGHLLPLGQGIIERVVSISGNGVSSPGNYLIPIGTPIEFILETVGLNCQSPKVIFGGPMMGKPVVSLSTSTTKGVTGIIVSKAEHAKPEIVMDCISCGECVKACPLYLNPAKMGLLAENRRLESLVQDYHLFDCFECGSCSWVCPSKIPLTQAFKAAKFLVRNKKIHPLKAS